MSTTESESGIDEYVPFTPFQEGYAFEAEPSAAGFVGHGRGPLAATPFIAEYAGEEPGLAPRAAELQELLHELYDREFDEALGDLAEEAWNAVNDRQDVLGETVGSSTAEEFLEQWAAPLRARAEAMIDNVAHAVSEHDAMSMSDAELDAFFERLEPNDTGLEPHFEDFLGKLAKKVAAVAKKAVDVAKKGLTMVPGIAPLLAKLKALVRPLLDRVLKLALDKLPPQLRPAARQLAQRLLGTVASEAGEGDDFATPAVPDVAAIQQQFDLDAAALVFAEAVEQEVIVTEAAHDAERTDGSPIAELHEARARFVDSLERGVDPQEALQDFIPAVMAVLPIARTVIGVIGRQRVVDFLAGFMANMIGKYVPANASRQLSQAIVDTGLRMMSLEAPTESEVEALGPNAIAATVEDAVRRLAEAEESTFEHAGLLEVAAALAFQEAAAENFPPQLIRPELHESTVGGSWVAMPLGKGRKYYRKYTRVFDVEITPQIAAALQTFGGTTIAAFLKDQLGVSVPVQARVHVYQALPGTSPARIARLEGGVRGLGPAAKGAASQLHPLSPRAAGVLLRQPGLGRRAPGRFRSSRRLTAVGQRFYFLEVAGARSAAAAVNGAAPAVRRSSEANLTLDFPKDEFRVFVYLSEADAQDIASKIRRRDVTAALVAARKIYEAGIVTALGGDIQRHVKIVSEALPQDQFSGVVTRLADSVRARLAKKTVEWVGKALADHLTGQAGEFTAATEAPEDGATIVVTLVSPPGAPLVRRLLKGELNPAQVLADLDSIFKGEPRLAVSTVPGFRFD
jgi:hypothetical protein